MVPVPSFEMFSRILCAAALVAALIAPAALVEAAGEQAALERTRAQLAEIRIRLAAAKGEAAVIRKEVRALEAQIAALNRQIRTGEQDVSTLESEIRSAEAQIAELEQQYVTSQQASNERARRLYKTGPAEALSQLLDASSVGEFVRMTLWWSIAAELDGKVMLDAARIKTTLVERKADLEATKTDLQLHKQWLEERRALIADAKADKDRALAGVQHIINQEEKHIRDLEAQSRALTAVLRSRVSQSSGAVSRQGFIWPLNGRVTSEYGRRGGGFHSGIDIDGNTGDPIKASKAGDVVTVSCGSGYGICTIIDHGGGVATLYAHMSRKAISSGRVSQGQVIGYVGCTGSCSGSHLHFEVRVNGEPRNPREFLP